VSAVPGEFMGASKTPQPPVEDEGEGGTVWQWLAIGVLVGCWLAEATWCMDHSY
jgi:hypothetical protein